VDLPQAAATQQAAVDLPQAAATQQAAVDLPQAAAEEHPAAAQHPKAMAAKATTTERHNHKTN
jgi:hypothetical protein